MHSIGTLRYGNRMDESEQKAIADLLRTVRIAIVVMAIVAGVGANEMMGVI